MALNSDGQRVMSLVADDITDKTTVYLNIGTDMAAGYF